MLQLYLLYYNSRFLVTIIISKEEKFFTTSYKKKMKSTYFIYLLCVSILAVQGFITIRDFKIDAVTRGTETTKSLSTSLSSYSQYLQSLN